ELRPQYLHNCVPRMDHEGTVDITGDLKERFSFDVNLADLGGERHRDGELALHVEHDRRPVNQVDRSPLTTLRSVNPFGGSHRGFLSLLRHEKHDSDADDDQKSNDAIDGRQPSLL